MTTLSSPRICAARAAPAAWLTCVAIGEESVTYFVRLSHIHSLPVVIPPGGDDDAERSRTDADASQAGAAPNEFVFETVEAGQNTGRGMNIKSCAICHLFGQYDAMELVPYMCSFDDVVSDALGQGLRRTGTIALGAKHCDFRFQDGGEPLRLAGQYPDRIRLDEA